MAQLRFTWPYTNQIFYNRIQTRLFTCKNKTNQFLYSIHLNLNCRFKNCLLYFKSVLIYVYKTECVCVSVWVWVCVCLVCVCHVCVCLVCVCVFFFILDYWCFWSLKIIKNYETEIWFKDTESKYNKVEIFLLIYEYMKQLIEIFINENVALACVSKIFIMNRVLFWRKIILVRKIMWFPCFKGIIEVVSQQRINSQFVSFFFAWLLYQRFLLKTFFIFYRLSFFLQ